MAKQAHYTPEQQREILSEAENALAKALAPLLRKHPTLTFPWTVGIAPITAPLSVAHSGNTRPLPRERVAPGGAAIALVDDEATAE